MGRSLGRDRKRKAVSPAGNGGDSAITKDFSQRRDLNLKVVLLHHQSRPHDFEQLVLCDKPLASFDEREENIECPIAQQRRPIVDQELSRDRVQREAAEFVVRRHGNKGRKSAGNQAESTLSAALGRVAGKLFKRC